VFPDGAGLFQAVAGRIAQPGIFIWIMTFGAAADAERGQFADFLDEAGILLDQPKLAPVANKFREIAPLWRYLAEAALPDRIPILRKTRDLWLQQRDLYVEQGQARNAKRREIRGAARKQRETHRRGRTRGSWRFTGNIAGDAIDRAYTVRQTENKIEGPCKNQIGEVVLHGEVDGTSITSKY
jgi:hypothetical protein